MFTTITHTIKRHFLGAGVSLLLVASVVVPSAMLAQQAPGDETLVAIKETEPTDGGGTDAPATCVPNPGADLRAPDGTPFNPFIESHVVVNGSTASIQVKNFSTDCTYPIHIAAYKVFDQWGTPEFISTQTLFDDTADSIAPGQTKTISVSIFASCQYQIDFFEGPAAPQTNPDFANPPLINTHYLFDWAAGLAPLPLCGTPPPPPTCVPNPGADLRAPDGTPFNPFIESRVIMGASSASIQVKNFSESCDYEGRLASFNVFDQWGTPEFISTQTLFDDTVISIPHGQTRTLTVSIPECATQVDFFTGPYTPQSNPDFANPPLINTHHLFDWGAELTPLCGQENPARLRLIKTVINDNGGTKQVSDFTLYVDATQVLSNAVNTFSAGVHTVREDQLPGYTAGMWGGDCTPNGVVTLVAGQIKTCTITNNDNPVSNPATLTIIKTVINDDGGIKQVADFHLYAGNTPFVSGVSQHLQPGTYTLHEDQLPGYTAGAWGGDCSANGTITLASGDAKTCTITNNDNPVPPNPAYVRVIKTVINDDGGIKQVSDFKLYVNNALVVSGATNAFAAGAYTVREDQLPGYAAGAWGGDCSANGSVTLVAGQTKTCTIVNNDVPNNPTLAYLKVVKTVINDDGGTKLPTDFPLYVDKQLVQHNATNPFTPGLHTVAEINQAGYTAGVWGGDCAADGTITLVAGDSKTCTITNNDTPIITNPATLTVIKTVINDDGGTNQVADFYLYVNNTKVLSGVANQFSAGAYTLHEDQLPGYTAGAWGGDCAADGTITLALGDAKTCTITNNDTQLTGWESHLIVIKTVINDDGGTKEVSDFNLYVERVNSEAPTVRVISGEKNDFAPGHYVVSEGNLSGYTAGAWGGDCLDNGTVTLIAGETQTCTITNNDNPSGGGDDDDDDDDDGGGGGGGSSRRHPKVVLFTNPEVLGASVSLVQVPYTGLGTSLFQIFLFIVGLLAISGGVTYVIARRRENEYVTEASTLVHQNYTKEATPIIEESLPEVDALSAYDEYVHRVESAPVRASYDEQEVATPVVPEVPVDLPVAPAIPVADVVAQSRAVHMVAQHSQAVAQNTISLARLQDAARASRALVSEDGMKLITNSAEGNEQKAFERLSQVIDIAKTRYPREDGWLVLDKGRVRESLFISTLSMVPLFVEWMVRGEDKNIFGFLRMLKSQEQPVADFMRKVVAELDNAHRARLEGAEEKTSVNPHIAEVTYHLSNNDLEVIISELLQGVDERYDSAYTSVRLALVRVLDVIKERQFTHIGGTYTFSSQNQEA